MIEVQYSIPASVAVCLSCLRYLYWLSGGQVRRCPLNLAVECLAKAEQIPTSLSSVNDFAIDSASNDTVLYRVTGNQLSVSGPAGDSETVSMST